MNLNDLEGYDNLGDYLLDTYRKEHVENNLILYLAGLDETALEKAESAMKFLSTLRSTLEECAEQEKNLKEINNILEDIKKQGNIIFITKTE